MLIFALMTEEMNPQINNLVFYSFGFALYHLYQK